MSRTLMIEHETEGPITVEIDGDDLTEEEVHAALGEYWDAGTPEIGVEEDPIRSNLKFKKEMQEMVARGIRNNNPGNIEHGEDWNGMHSEQTDDRFIRFESPEMGIRAMSKIMQTYKNKHGIDTVQGVINRWAPPHENETNNYASFVATRMGIEPGDKIDLSDPTVLKPLMMAMTFMENGENPYEESIFDQGIQLAGLRSITDDDTVSS